MKQRLPVAAPPRSSGLACTRGFLMGTLGLGLVVQVGLAQGSSGISSPHFPKSSAIAEGISPDGLTALGTLVQGFVDDGDVVGAELLVIKNGKSILHEAYGMRDREADEAMVPGSVFCVRSMTKPLIGASILMLIDDRRLEFDDPVSKFVPAFDVKGLREVTIEHLLTHTSGLPMSQIMAADLNALQERGGIQAVAGLSEPGQLLFPVGEGFHYSDQGTDTLTAVIEGVTGESAATFVEKRLLAPLGMEETACVMDLDSPLRERGCSKYLGSSGSWSPFWDTSKPPLFPFFLGSQGLYSTLTDYARFMEFWERKGRAGKERILPSRHVRKALTPGPFPMDGATGFPDLRVDYGFLMQLWTGPGDSKRPDRRELVAFGHTGSDGTHAWVFPEQDAMVLYFTQSRGTTTGLRVEEALGNLILGTPFDPQQAAPPLDEYTGFYREDPDDKYRAVIRDGKDLALEILGRAVVPLTYIGDDRWKMRPNPSVILEFDRSESGVVSGYHIGDHYEYRFEPAERLPDPGELGERVAETHGLATLETAGPLVMESELEIPKLNMTGTSRNLTVWPDRFRVDNAMSGQEESYSFDGEHVRYSATGSPAATVDGLRASALRDAHLIARLGDWTRFYPKVQVVQRISWGMGGDVYLVRMGDLSAPAATLYVESASGRVIGEDRMTFTPGMGRIGQKARFDDFREVEGMLLPYRTVIEVANPMLGSIEVSVTGFELGVEYPADTFALEN